MPRSMSVDEFLRLYKLLKRRDVLDALTYVNASTKARFICPIYGEYWVKPSLILYGSVQGHPKTKWKRAVETRMKTYGTKKIGGRRKQL